MGSRAYRYFVPYEADLQSALDKLREREFNAGRYNPVIPFPAFSEPAFSEQTPGPKHRSIDAALKAAAEDGTRSILDVERVGVRADYGTAGPYSLATLESLYGTDKPTRPMLTDDRAYLDDIERGMCKYIIVYEEDAPREILFAGWSFD